MKNFIVFCLLFSSSFKKITSQNLIANSSFEEIYSSKVEGRNLDKNDIWTWPLPKSWFQIIGTVDYYANVQNGKGDQQLKFAFSSPKTGSSIVGLLPNSEILSGSLTDTLEAGETYTFSTFVQLSDFDRYGLTYLDVSFYGAKPESIHRELSLNDNNENINDPDLSILRDSLIGQIRIPLGSKKSNRNRWIKITQTYVAIGGECYFILGNLSKSKECRVGGKKISNRMWSKSRTKGYYLFDDFCLVKGIDTATCLQTLSQTENREISNYQLDSPLVIVLENLLFKTSSSELSIISRSVIDNVIPILKTYNNTDSIIFIVAGHTDSTGYDERNKELSQARAAAVASYLVSKGIDQTKITVVGYGSSRPVASNDSEYGRLKNRRVEITIKSL